MLQRNVCSAAILIVILAVPELAAAVREPLRPSTYPFEPGAYPEVDSNHPIRRAERRNILKELLGGESSGKGTQKVKVRPPRPQPRPVVVEERDELQEFEPAPARVTPASPPPGERVASLTPTSESAFQETRSQVPATRIRRSPTTSWADRILGYTENTSPRVSPKPARPAPRTPQVRPRTVKVVEPTPVAEPRRAVVDVASLAPPRRDSPGVVLSPARQAPQSQSSPSVSGWRGGYHKVIPGDTLSAISRKYGVSMEEIRKFNVIDHKSSLRAGGKLYVPPRGPRMRFTANGPVPVETTSTPRVAARPAAAQATTPVASVPLKPELLSESPRQTATRRVASARRPATRTPSSVSSGTVRGVTGPRRTGGGSDGDGSGIWDKIKGTATGIFAGIRKLTGGDDEEDDGDGVKEHAPSRSNSSGTARASTGRPRGNRPRFLWPVSGTITSRFGVRNGVPHNGIDIGTAKGTRILAAADGNVIYSASMRGYGNVIILDHGNQYFTVYAHNSKNLVKQPKKGATVRVKRGQAIALVGQTGNATGPHVHFEVRYRNKAVDPAPYLPSSQPRHHAAAEKSGDSDSLPGSSPASS